MVALLLDSSPSLSICIMGIQWRMMVGDFLKAPVDMLPSPTLDGVSFLRFGIPDGGGCDVPHRPPRWFYSDFHSSKFSTILQNCLALLSLPVPGTLFRSFNSSPGLHQFFSSIKVGSQLKDTPCLISRRLANHSWYGPSSARTPGVPFHSLQRPGNS